MPSSRRRDLAEIFGYAPTDVSVPARRLWDLGACPFTEQKCIKHNNDNTIVYGVCAVHSSGEDIIVCPNRLYSDDYSSLRRICREVFAPGLSLFTFSEFVSQRASIGAAVVALGMTSGKEVKVKQSMSMDWILVHVDGGRLVSYVGVEVQSIDITGNYRDAWHAYRHFPRSTDAVVPSSAHGLNWANVHKRLIPQLIRKGNVYASSRLVNAGLYFVLPDVVFRKFEELLGVLEPAMGVGPDVMTVHTYRLGDPVSQGGQRQLVFVRRLAFTLGSLKESFVGGANLPSGEDLDAAVKAALGLS